MVEVSQKNWVQQAREAVVSSASSLMDKSRSVGVQSKGMGVGLRLSQAYFALVLLAALAYALATAPGNFAYDFSLVHSFAIAALTTVCVWLFQKRASTARTFGIATAVACMVLSAFDMFAFGAFESAAAQIGPEAVAFALSGEYAAAAAVIVYLAVSQRARSVLSVQLDRAPIACDCTPIQPARRIGIAC